MRTVEKKVYYCDHCTKHGLSRASMEKHERHCTANPERVCGWRIDGHGQPDMPALIAGIRVREPLTANDISWLHDEVVGCPACMLAVLRQSGLEYHYDTVNHQPLFDYMVEVELLRAREREDARNDQW